MPYTWNENSKNQRSPITTTLLVTHDQNSRYFYRMVHQYETAEIMVETQQINESANKTRPSSSQYYVMCICGREMYNSLSTA